MFDRFYESSAEGSCSPQDRFRLLMVFAISAVTLYRAGLSSCHPYRYYLAALTWADEISLIGTVDAVQNLLLVARFGMYYHVGISLWELSHFCMRQCVELGYHLEPEWPLSPLTEQARRRVLWECYILDRYNSSILGRPFAIDDESITAHLPVIADDETLESSDTHLLSAIPDAPPTEPNELSVFVSCIRLRRITSQIYTDFYSGRKASSRSSGSGTPSHPPPSAGQARMLLHHHLTQLSDWRRSQPIFPHPKSLYERAEWYDFMEEKDKLTLIRGAMSAVPKRRNNLPSSDLLQMCVASARRVIHLYADMQAEKYITWTRTYFQVIFMAGLSIVHCLFGATRASSSQQEMTIDQEESLDALATCMTVLETFKVEMPDAQAFALIFDQLSKMAFRRCNRPWPCDQQHLDMSLAPEQQHHVTTSQQQHIPHQSEEAFALPDIDWSITDELMDSIGANLGEYAWSFPGDELFHWDFDDI